MLSFYFNAFQLFSREHYEVGYSFFKPFVPNAPFLYPLRTALAKGALGTNGLKDVAQDYYI